MLLIISQILVMIVFMYMFWRGLRENYHDYKLIIFSWLVLLSFLVLGRIGYVLVFGSDWNSDFYSWYSFSSHPGFSIVFGYLGVLLVAFLTSKRNNWKLWPLLEDMTKVIVPFLVLIGGYLGDIKIVVSMMLTWGLLILVGNRYRSFVWYRSGKKGFLWFWANAWGFVLLAVGTLVFKDGLHLALGYLILGLISGGGLFMLGR